MSCKVQHCTAPARSHGLCSKHYTRWYRHKDPHVTKNLPPGSEPYDSILKHGTKRWGECLLYLGKTNGASGYGMTYGKLLAHRVAYEKWHGPIPPGYWVDHLCHNIAAAGGECAGGGTCLHRLCVNPGHLAASTPRANTLASPLTGGKTHCRHGHEYTPENTYWQPQSRGYGYGRVCKACRQINSYRSSGTGG